MIDEPKLKRSFAKVRKEMKDIDTAIREQNKLQGSILDEVRTFKQEIKNDIIKQLQKIDEKLFKLKGAV